MVTILFIPIVTILMACLRTDATTGLLTRFSSSGVVSFGPEALPYAIISIIFLVLFVPYCLLMGLLNFEISPKSDDIMARSNSRLDFFYIITKTTLVLVTDLGSHLVAFRAVFLPILMLVVICHILLAVPYYRPWVDVMRGALFGAIFGAGIDVPLGLYAVPERTVSIALLMHFGLAVVFGTIVAGIMWLRISHNQRAIKQGRLFWMKKMIAQKTKSPKADRQVSSARNSVARNSTTGTDQISLRSFGRGSTSKVPLARVPAKSSEKKTGFFEGIWHGIKGFFYAMQAQVSVIFLAKSSTADSIDLADAIFQQYLEKIPHGHLVRVLYGSFIVNYRNDWIGATVQISRVRNSQPGFDTRWMIFVMDKQIERLKRSGQIGADAASGLMSFVEFQHNFAKARKSHLETLKRMRMFWEVLLSDDTMLHKLGQSHLTLVKAETTTIRVYSHLLANFSSSPILWRSYASFLQDIRNEQAEAERCFQFADDIEEKQAQKHRRKAEGPYARANKESMTTELVREEVEKDDKVETPTHALPAVPEVATTENGDTDGKPGMLGGTTDDQTSTAGSTTEKRSKVGGSTTDQHRSTNSSTSFGRRGATGESEKRGVITLSRRFTQALAVMLVVLIANFIVIIVLINTQNANVESVNLAGVVRVTAVQMVADLIFPAVQTYFNGTSHLENIGWDVLPDGVEAAHTEILRLALEFVEEAQELWARSHAISPLLVEYWENHEVDIREYPSELLKKYHLIDAFEAFERRIGRLISEMDSGLLAPEEIPINPDFEFLVENGLGEMQEATNELVDHYLEVFAGVTEMLQIVVLSVAGFCVLLICFVGLAVFRPAMDRIHQEKHLTLSLFILIPKPDIYKIVKGFRQVEEKVAESQQDGSEDDLDQHDTKEEDERMLRRLAKDKGNSDRVSGDTAKQELFAHKLAVQHASTCTEMHAIYGKTTMALLLLALVIGGHTLTMVTGIMGDVEMAIALDKGTKRQELLGSMAVLSMARPKFAEVLFHTGWDAAEMAQEEMHEFWRIHWALLYGNASMGLGDPSTYVSPELHTFSHDVVGPLVYEALDAMDSIMFYNQSKVHYGLVEYKHLMHTYDHPGTLMTALRKATIMQRNEIETSHANVQSQNIIWLVAEVIVVTFIFFIILRSITRALSEDMESVHRILRLTPAAVVRKSDSIRHYLLDPEQFREKLESRVELARNWSSKAEKLGTAWSAKLLEKYPNGVVVSDNKGRIVFSNRKFESMVSRTEDELIGSPVIDMISSIHQPQFQEAVKTASLSTAKADIVLDVACKKRGGSTFAVKMTVRSVKNAGSGGKQRLVACIVDQVEQATTVKPEADWLATAMKGNTSALIVNMGGNVTLITPKAADLISVTSDGTEKPLKKVLMESSLTESSVTAACHLVDMALGAPDQHHATDGQIKHGDTILDVRLAVDVVADDSERRIVLGIEDVGEMKVALRSMKKNQAMIKSIVESMDTAMFVISENDNVFMVNEQAAELAETNKSLLIGRPMAQLFTFTRDDVTTTSPSWANWSVHLMNTPSGSYKQVEIRIQMPEDTDFICISARTKDDTSSQ